jgi:hypothetical protein
MTRKLTQLESLSKMLRSSPYDHIASDWSNRCNSVLTLQALKMSKINLKNLKRSNFGGRRAERGGRGRR